jgi:hypothetical protein
MVTNFSQNLPCFFCENCDFITNNKKDYSRHILTRKHQNGNNGNKMVTQITPELNECVCECGNVYKYNSGLSRHKKVCCYKQNNNHNNDLIQYLISENKEFKNLILEIVKKDNSINQVINNNNTNNVNSHNKTFNLQFFLNETCKDAMNMSEFIDSMKLQLSDLEAVGKLGFVDGISNIIIKNLKALDVEKRPVHCSDTKRETVYIKDQDKWEKEDDEMMRMKEMVRSVRDKNISLISSWRDLYPECLLSNSKKTDQYNNICMESFGFKHEKEEKIISKIAKSVVIDKRD